MSAAVVSLLKQPRLRFFARCCVGVSVPRMQCCSFDQYQDFPERFSPAARPVFMPGSQRRRERRDWLAHRYYCTTLVLLCAVLAPGVAAWRASTPLARWLVRDAKDFTF